LLLAAVIAEDFLVSDGLSKYHYRVTITGGEVTVVPKSLAAPYACSVLLSVPFTLASPERDRDAQKAPGEA